MKKRKRGEPDTPPPRPRNVSILTSAFFRTVVLALLAAIGAGYAVVRHYTRPLPPPDDVTVEAGEVEIEWLGAETFDASTANEP